jgi:hypothetical protein
VRIRRAIISPLVTLGIAGSVITGIAVPLGTVAASSTPVAGAAHVTPLVYFHG